MKFDFGRDPLAHFQDDLREAEEKGLPEPTGMTLATVSSQGQPTCRTVLFKGLYQNGLTFYTNYEGRKAQELATQPKASANFWWPQLEKQVRFDGVVEKLPRDVSEAYFATRPRLSQLGAWASHQSSEISDWETLKQRLEEVQKKFEGKTVPCPPHWGGYVLRPHEVEFWIGHEGRLHERYVYQRQGEGWKTFMRSP